MSFLFPAFLIGSFAIAIPIVLHLWRRDVVPRVAFSDIRFLTRAPVTRQRLRRFRELLLLALRVMALLLLVVAFARPFVDSTGLLERSVTVVTLDRSFSLAGPGIFEGARAAAREAVADAPTAHAVGLVVFDHRAQVAHDLSMDRGSITASLRQVTPGPGSTGFAGAIAAAVEMIGPRTGRIVVVTDLQRSGWVRAAAADVPPGIAVGVVGVESSSGNLAVTSVQTGPSGVSAVVLNGGSETSAAVSLYLDGTLVTSREAVLPSGTSALSFDSLLPPTGVLEVAVDDPAGTPADNSRYVLLDPPPPVALGVVTNNGRTGAGAFYLERALEVGDDESPFSVVPMSPESLSNRDLSDLDVVVLVGSQGLDRNGRERLAAFTQRGGGLLIIAGPTLDPDLVADVLGGQGTLAMQRVVERVETGFAVTDSRHPVFQAFDGLIGTFGQVRVRQSMFLVESEGSRVLARFDDGPAALVEYAVNSGRAVVFASDLNNEWNDFPRRPTFVPFVHEMMHYLAGSREQPREWYIEEVPSGVEATPGPVTLDTGRRVVINVNPQESDTARLSSDAFLSHVRVREPESGDLSAAAPAGATREAEQGYWWYALLAMVLVLAAEVWLGRTIA